jgi:DNA (cytosine-5)-methyltransferase 1
MVTVISTFAGGGGSSLGYHWAGFTELLAIDFDKNSCDTLKANFDFPVWQRDITTVTAEEIFDFCKIKKGDLDVLDGSPPCQGFSTAGKRNLNDSRNDLFKDFVRLIEGLQPKVFVMENVSGMIKGGYKGKFNEIMQTLKNTGYNVKCKLMNAMWYEVPQSRERVFFIGVRNDLNIEPSYPKPLEKSISIKEALYRLEDIGEIYKNTSPKFNLIVPQMKEGQQGTDIKGITTGFQMVKPYYNKPCPTITKVCTGTWFSGLIHPLFPRLFTINELKRLASFPDNYKFSGTFQEQWSRIGNAVMPKMMYHIAKHIKENILNGTSKS